jgi:hypothetical protein
MMTNVECPVCKGSLCSEGENPRGWTRMFSCTRCGKFVVSDRGYEILERRFEDTPLRRSAFSHTIRKISSSGKPYDISDADLFDYLSKEAVLPDASQQAIALITWIGTHQTSVGISAKSWPLELAGLVGTSIDVGDPDIAWLVEELKREGTVSGQLRDGKYHLSLTLSGWRKFAELKRVHASSRTAFMAMKFGDAILDQVVDKCFRQAVSKAGFELKKLTDEQPAGCIDNQIRAAILSGRFVIADLTHGSHGAYWEAGFAEGLGLPVIYTCEKAAWDEKKTHFDTNHLLTIIWDANDLKGAAQQLTAAIRATLRDEAIHSDQ